MRALRKNDEEGIVMDKLHEESRMQFEDSYRENYLSGVGLLERSTEIGSYIDAHAQGHWETWQASRANIVVELPEKVMIEDEFDNGHNCAIDYCAESIRSIGLSIKGD